MQETLTQYIQGNAFPGHTTFQAISRLEYFTAAALTGLCADPKFTPKRNHDLADKAISIAMTTLVKLHSEKYESTD